MPSRAPVYLVIGGLTLAVTLVLLAAAAAQQRVPAPAIERPGTVDAPRELNVIMRDYAFVPSPITVVRGETVRFNIVNGGLVPHELVLGDARIQDAWQSADAAATPPGPFATAPAASVAAADAGLRVVLASGAQVQVAFRVPAAGDLSLVCHLPGHAQRGMVSGVTVLDVGSP